MVKSYKTFKDIIYVMFSNIISLISSIVNGFVLPYILGVTNYGYYRTFILYSTYTALLHCGFVDGILLKYSGVKYNNLNKKIFRTYTSIFIIFQFIISICLSLLSIFVTNKFYSFLLITLGTYTFIYNILTYYLFISQTTMRFSLLSFRNTIQSLLFIIFTITIYFVYKIGLFKNINYNIFIYIMIIIYLIMLLWYMYTYRNITFGSHYSLKKGICYLYKLCKIGIYLTISYQVSNLIMIIDNQFISLFFKASTYGKYSFSYSIVNTALTVLGAVATVLLPHLKRNTVGYIIYNYDRLISSMMLFIYFSLLAYFPLCLLIKIILPKYVDSLIYLKFFAPELGVTCTVTMITFNYYNALNKSKFYFYISVIVLLLSFIIDSVSYIVFHNTIWIAFGSFISIFIWYIVSEYFLVKWYHVKWIKNLIYMTIMISSFILTSFINNVIEGLIFYFIIYSFVSLIMFKNVLLRDIKIIFNTLKDS